jgi:hypothetical protein
MAKPGKYLLSKHAEQEIGRRRTPRAWVDALDTPEQRIQQSEHVEILPSRFTADGGEICGKNRQPGRGLRLLGCRKETFIVLRSRA